MTYQYKVVKETNKVMSEADLNALGAAGWKLVTVSQLGERVTKPTFNDNEILHAKVFAYTFIKEVV
jgi:hypothetical protein